MVNLNVLQKAIESAPDEQTKDFIISLADEHQEIMFERDSLLEGKKQLDRGIDLQAKAITARENALKEKDKAIGSLEEMISKNRETICSLNAKLLKTQKIVRNVRVFGYLLLATTLLLYFFK